jgi:hypothetical protein
LRKNCLLKHVIEGKMEWRLEVTGRRGRGLRQLLNILKEKRGYWKLKEVTLDHIVCRTRFGIGYGPGVRQTAKWTNEFWKLRICAEGDTLWLHALTKIIKRCMCDKSVEGLSAVHITPPHDVIPHVTKL